MFCSSAVLFSLSSHRGLQHAVNPGRCMKEDSKAASPNDLVLLICHMNVCQAGFGRRSGWEKTFSLLFYHHISARVSSAGTKEKHIGCRNSCQAWLKILKHIVCRDVSPVSTSRRTPIPTQTPQHLCGAGNISIIISPHLSPVPTFSHSSLPALFRQICARPEPDFDIHT